MHSRMRNPLPYISDAQRGPLARETFSSQVFSASLRAVRGYGSLAPAAIHRARIARSTSLMRVLFPGGIVRVTTARS